MNRGGWFILPAALFFFINFSVSSVKVFFISLLIHSFFLVFFFTFLRRFNLNSLLRPVVAGIGSILFAYGLVQKFILFPRYLQAFETATPYYYRWLEVRIKSGRIFTIFPLPTLYAIVCALLLIFIVHYFLQAGKGRILWLGLFLLGAANLILTQSFGGVLCFAVGIVGYFLFSGIIRLKYLAPVMMVLSLFLFIIVGLRFSEARHFKPVKLRLTNWNQALRMIAAHPVLGVGLGNYKANVSTYTRDQEARSIYTHNFFLQICAETGLPLMLLFMTVLVLHRRRFRIKNPRDNAVYLASLLALAIYCFIDIGLYLFSAALVATVVLSQIYRREDNKFHVPLVVSLLLLLPLSLVSISDNLRKNGYLSSIQGDARGAERYYERSIRINPFNFSAHGAAADFYFKQNRFSQAGYHVDRGLWIYPDSSWLNHLKSQLAVKNLHFYTAFYHAARAVEKDPNNRYYKNWYESIKKNLQAKILQPGN